MTYSGRTTLHSHKFDDWQTKPVPSDANPGVKKVWMLDAQWSTCPVEVENQVRDLWQYHECGNDHFVIKTKILDLISLQKEGEPVDRWDETQSKWVEGPIKTDLVVQYLREQGVHDDDLVLIHWWW